MEIAFLLFNILLIGFLSWYFWKSDTSTFRKIYWPALLVKLGAGLLLGYIYSVYYIDSDTVRFFDSSIELSDLARKDFSQYIHYLWAETDAPYSGENRTLFFVKSVSLFAVITRDNYWIVSLYFSFVSFISAWWLTRIISMHFTEFTWPAVFAFLLFPSCVFWSSGVIKETMAITGLYVLAGIFVTGWMNRKLSYGFVVLAALSLWIVWSLKYYYAALFMPVVATAFLTRWFVEKKMRPSSRSAYREGVLFIVLLMVMFFVVTFIHPNFYPQRILEVIVENYTVFIQASDPGKAIQYHALEPTFGSILVNMPWAIASGLFRPFIWEAANIFQVLVSLENVVLFLLMMLAVRTMKTATESNQRILIFGTLIFCLLLCAFLALSAPNFGTLVRYRIGFLPFFVLLVSYKSGIVRFISKIFKS